MTGRNQVLIGCLGTTPQGFYDLQPVLSRLGDIEIEFVASVAALSELMNRRRLAFILSELAETSFTARQVVEVSRGAYPDVPVVFMGPSSILDSAVEAVREGAFDFIPLPSNPKILQIHLERVLGARRLRTEISNLQRELRFRRNADYIVGASPGIQAILGQILRIADSEISVLITGESGTGKDLVARAIHYNSHRADGPFVTVNCATLSESLFENEVFGHVRGSYTGADTSTIGLFGAANGGTLFLDEIAEVSPANQAKLLRVLESGEYRQIGSTEKRESKVRIISATKRNLEEAIGKNAFRQDLYFRLNVLPIAVPPLRDRKEDIPQLVQHFMNLFEDELSKTIDGISPSALQKLMFHSWPGNVRELSNKIRQAIINAGDRRIFREDIELVDSPTKQSFKSFRDAKREFEENYITNVLRITHGNVAEAARLAKKDRKDFYEQMAKFGIKADEYRLS